MLPHSLYVHLRAVIVVSLPVKALRVPCLWNCISPSKPYGEMIAVSWGKGEELFCPVDDVKRLYPSNNRKA